MVWEDNFESRGDWDDFKDILEIDRSWSMRRHALLFNDEVDWDTDAEWDAGTHSGTSASSNKLVAGGGGGNWISPVIQNNYHDKTPVFKDIFWKEALGNVTSIEVRGSNVSAAQVLSNTFRTINEDSANRNYLNWFEWKWIQFRITLPANAEVSLFRFHHLWNTTDYTSRFGALNFQRDIGESRTKAGDTRIRLSNYDGTFDQFETQATYFNEGIEVWLGLEKTGTIYLFPFYVGFIDDMIFHKHDKSIDVESRNVFGRYLEIKVALQTTSTPFRDQAVFYGLHNYAKTRQDETDKKIFYLDSKYNLSAISAVYVNRVLQTSGVAVNVNAPGTITFTAQPSGTVEADCSGLAMTNAMDIVEHLFETEAGFDVDYIFERDSFDLARTRATAYTLGNVKISKDNLVKATEEVLRHVNGIQYVDHLTQTRLGFHIFYPEALPDNDKISFEDNPAAASIAPMLDIRHSREDWANRVEVKFKVGLETYTYEDAEAIAEVGESVTEYSLPYLASEAEVIQAVQQRFYLFRVPLMLHDFKHALPQGLTFNIRDLLDFYDASGYLRTLEVFGVVKDFDSFLVRSFECAIAYSSLINWAFAVDTVGDPRLWYAIDTDSSADPNWHLRSYAF